MRSTVFLMPAFALAALPAVSAEPASSEILTEVVVTATKREQGLLDVPAPVSVVTGAQLQEMGAQSLADYVTKLPGVHFNDYQPGVSEVIIRGVSATTYHEQGQTVVGYYINEIPLSEAGWPIVIPDVDTFDLQRVEVLRGPQGTLFGAAALGGLVNYIAREADPAAGFESAVEAMIGSTDNAGEENYAFKGMVNVPLVDDKLAVRVVGLQRFDAGFVDNITTGEEGSSDLTTRGARMSAVYEPSARTRLSWLTMYQEMSLEDQTYVIIGTYDRDTVVREPHDTELVINSLRLDQELGFARLTLLGAVADKDGRIVFDGTRTGWLQGPIPTEFISNVASDATHFEARLASTSESRVSWLLGATYYDSEKDIFDVTRQPGAAAFIDANPGNFGGNPGSLLAPQDNLNRYVVDQSNEDLAAFGEVSLELTDALTLTAGGRYFDTKSDTTVSRPPSASFVGVFDPVGSSFRETQDETGFTPKVSLAYKPIPSLLVYALYSEGFRVGGANPNPPGLTGVPTNYDSDTVDNYELGVRTQLAEGRVFLDLTAFRIDWNDIQVRLFTPAPFFYSYVTNAGEAQIDGVEFSTAWRVTPSFDLRASVTYQDAAVSEFLPDTFAPGGGHPAGTVLPGSSEWSTSETATLRVPGLPWSTRFEVSHRYLSDAPVAFSSQNTRGEFNIWDARVAATVREGVNVQLFGNNLSDEYGVLNAPFADFFVDPLGSVTRPRSYGVRVNLEF